MTTKKTKQAICTGCGKQTEVSLFMSALKAKCDDCKTGKQPQQGSNGFRPLTGPRIDGHPNAALRNLCCPYHTQKPMSIIGVVKSDWGDVVTLQCREEGCWLMVKISEQQRSAVKTTASGLSYTPDDILNRWPRSEEGQPNE